MSISTPIAFLDERHFWNAFLLSIVLNVRGDKHKCQSGKRQKEQVQNSGYNVRYHEFIGFHTVPISIAEESLNWFMMGAK